ncbi:MAG: lamin tail domain-containing protein [Proteobacteria bacterium]|nr:lamin tail domain-containing protein [Pseudomonadota bacterium]
MLHRAALLAFLALVLAACTVTRPGRTDDDDASDDDAIYPGAPEFIDAWDNDCAGVANEGAVANTDVVITEIMKNPSFTGDDCGEFFEVYNNSGVDLGILGWTFGDTDPSCAAMGDDFVAPDVVIPAGAHFVFVKAEDPAACPGGDGITPDVEYTGMILANGDDEVFMCVDGFLLDSVTYVDAGWPDPNGASFGLDPAVGFGGGQQQRLGVVQPDVLDRPVRGCGHARRGERRLCC